MPCRPRGTPSRRWLGDLQLHVANTVRAGRQHEKDHRRVKITHSLILEDSSKVSDDIDDAEDESILGANGQVGPSCVARNWLLCRCLSEQVMHCGKAADLGTCCIDREDESEDDGEEHACMCAMRDIPQ